MDESDDTQTDDVQPLDPETASPVPRGCFLGAFLCGLVVLGVAAYVIKRGDDLGGAARVGGVALIVLGTLLLLPFALVMGLRVLANFSADRAMRRSGKRSEGGRSD